MMTDSDANIKCSMKKFTIEEFIKNFTCELEENVSIFQFRLGENNIMLIDTNEIAKNMTGQEEWTIKDVFKANFYKIYIYLCEYFPNIAISIDYDCSGRIDEIIFGPNVKDDLNVKITFEKNGIKYECAFDYIDSHETLSESRKIKNLMHLDYYYCYEYGYENFANFIEKSLHRILIIGCTISNDEYKLAKILFIENFKNDEFFDDKYNIFKKIINFKKNNKFDLEEWYRKLNIYKDDRNITWYEFIRICQYNLDLAKTGIELDFDQTIVEFSVFEKILSVIDDSIDDNNIIFSYRINYCKAMELLIISLKDILELSKELSKKINFIPQYIANYMMNDIQNFSYDKEILEHTTKELKKKCKDKKNKK